MAEGILEEKPESWIWPAGMGGYGPKYNYYEQPARAEKVETIRPCFGLHENRNLMIGYN